MDEKKEIVPVLKKMKIFEARTFPIAQVGSIRVACSIFSIRYTGKFTVSANREQGIVTVTKIE